MDLQSVSMLVLIINTTISSSNKTIVWKLRAAYYQRPRMKEKANNCEQTKILSSNKKTLNLYLDGIHGIIPYS